MQKKPTMPLNADTINTLIDAMGAITLCLTRQLNPEQRTAFKNDLARLAIQAEKDGNITLETLLIDLRNAAVD
jgi:hypothetical protein